MPEYLILIFADEAAEDRLPPAETRALLEGHAAFERSLRAAAAYLDGERLRPSGEGRRVTTADGALRVESGPFAAPVLAGYYLVTAASLDDAVALARSCPLGPASAIDVRPVMASHVRPDKASERGHVFAFAVLGAAPTEAAWIDVMDRIDAETRDGFPPEAMRGGVRLHAPGRGKHVTATTVFDGPFLESKEVIGGLCFLRMPTIDAAVAWASTSPFVVHGALEIRELWRS